MQKFTKTYRIAFAVLVFSTIFTTLTFAQDETALLVIKPPKATKVKKDKDLFDIAHFPGCETKLSAYERLQCSDEQLELFIAEHLNYPESAKSQNFRPRIVKIEFTINAYGRILSPKILKTGERDYDKEAIAVFQKMIDEDIQWVPAVKEGEPITSTVNTNVLFTYSGRNKSFPIVDYEEDVFYYVDEVPAFASCQEGNLKDREIRDCTLEQLDAFFQEHINYPADALEVGLEGDVDVEFIVDRNGIVRNVFLKNDIGLGCGEETKRLFDLMNEQNIGWIPGEEDGQKVNVLLSTAVHFRIDPSKRPANKLSLMDAKPVFVTEREGLEDYLDIYLNFPKGDNVNPCQTGTVDVRFKVNQHTGDIEITNLIDYNSLGKDFKAAATSFINSTKGEWNVDYPNLGSGTQYFLSLPFVPDEKLCPHLPTGYKEALYSGMQGADIARDKSKLNDGLDLLDKALRTFPADNKLRYLRGMTYYNVGRKVEGCVDLSFVNKQNKDIDVPKSCK